MRRRDVEAAEMSYRGARRVERARYADLCEATARLAEAMTASGDGDFSDMARMDRVEAEKARKEAWA